MLAPAPSSHSLIVLLLLLMMMEWMQSFAPLQVEDAARLRLRISECFERAALPQTTPEVHLGARCWPGACCACSLVRQRWNGCRAAPDRSQGGRRGCCCVAGCACSALALDTTHAAAARSDTTTLPWLLLLQERKKLLSFVIVGGGPTGVEVAAELHDLITEDLVKLYPDQVGCGELKSGLLGQPHIHQPFRAS